MKYFLLPFGCQMNRSDSERLRSVLENMGYTEAADDNDPDIAVKGIVACSVRQKAIDRVYGTIRNWNRARNRQSLITFISGCILPADKEKFLKLFDLVFSMDQAPLLPGMIREYGVPSSASLQVANSETPESAIQDFWHLRPRYTSKAEAFVPIQNGCDKFCTFCAVPYTRGREVSRPSPEILEEVQSLVEQGCKSITLLGQNVNSYGQDCRGTERSFPELMEDIGKIGKKSGRDFWVYFTSPHPRDINSHLLEVMASYPVLADWIHLPLQSGDDKVLLKMNRNHSMHRYRDVVQNIRTLLPGAALFTDIIVGFPGETDRQFEATADAMREFEFDMAYIAAYSPRPGARSARWDDDVSREEKHRRFQKLSEILQEIGARKTAEKIGRRERVLVTSADRVPGHLSGYTQGRIPVRLEAPESLIGQFADVKITSSRPLSMQGELSA